MRTKKEINRAVAILRQKGDKLSLVQAAVIEDHRTESWVFVNYVQNVSADEKDETTFFAARDAARYVAGGIALEELIMDAETYAAAPIEEQPDGIIQMLIQQIDALKKRVQVLEADKKKAEARPKNIYKTIAIARPGDDHITQATACKYIGCTKQTLQGWAKQGMIARYLNGRNVYYSKREIDRNEKVQMYIRKLQNNTAP